MDSVSLVFLTIVLIVPVGAAVLSWLIREPWRSAGAARMSYECGEISDGGTRFPWKVGFVPYLVLFLLFDLELLLVLPWLVGDGPATGRGAVGVGAFIASLLWGLWYPLRRGLNRWQK